jgi:TolB protein
VGQASQDDPIPEFEALLMQAIEMHDFAEMQSLMEDSFALAFWQSEGLTISPGEAIEQLRLNHLLAGNTIWFLEGPDLSPQLGGRDILGIWDPAVNPVRALYSLGWGREGNGEAFLIIAQRPDGGLYWYAMLMTSPGFADRAVEHPVNDPSVRISPLSGPPGTLVRVIASGFPPGTSVSVGVGPANSQFGEVAQGTTDAHGAFVIQVPVQGEPGMELVFAVASVGQPGVTAPHLFQITGPLATIIPTPAPVLTPTPTPYLDVWTTFSSSVYAISLGYPADWRPIPGYGDPETDEARYGAINGFFQISAMDADSIDAAAAAEAHHKLQPYGSQPKIETLQIQGQEARLILPSNDQPAGMQHQAALIVRYPEPVNLSGTPCRFFVLWADWPHIRTIGQTLQFAR